MKCLDFVRGDGIPYPSKRAKGMFSKEDEYVPFFGEFTMAGAVENYLCELEKRMQTTLCQVLENAKQSADLWEIQSKREIWLQDYCAQIALLATQIMWTDETIRAFDDLEGGSETAMKEYLN
jgi:dynein heavy chain